MQLNVWRIIICTLSFSFLSCTGSSTTKTEHTLSIAAAADTIYLFRALKTDFAISNPDIKLQVTHAASGTLVAQIENGAPFDLFFSADEKYARRLAENNYGKPETLFHYGTGKLVLYISHEHTIDKDKFQLTDLMLPEIKKIAIANPAHAPYGELAKRVLEQANLFDKLQPKFILGENISQTFQYIQSGNADAGLISLSLTKNPELTLQGTLIQVPAELNPTLQQYAIQLKNSKNQSAAETFLNYLKSLPGQKILQDQGFKD